MAITQEDRPRRSFFRTPTGVGVTAETVPQGGVVYRPILASWMLVLSDRQAEAAMAAYDLDRVRHPGRRK